MRCLGTFNSLLLQGQYTPVQLNTSIYELYDPEKIRSLQHYFSDETKNGRLYINYPMVESLFDVKERGGEFFITPSRPLSLCSSSAYKTLIKKQTPFRSKSGHPLHILPPEDFAIVARASLVRYREILESANTKWNLTDISALLESEIKATEDEVIYPLSCFPFMALDYNAKEAMEEWDRLAAIPLNAIH